MQMYHLIQMLLNLIPVKKVHVSYYTKEVTQFS